MILRSSFLNDKTNNESNDCRCNKTNDVHNDPEIKRCSGQYAGVVVSVVINNGMNDKTQEQKDTYNIARF